MEQKREPRNRHITIPSYDMSATVFSEERMDFSINGAGAGDYPYGGMKREAHLSTHTAFDSGWTEDLNVESTTIGMRLYKEDIGKHLYDLRIKRDLLRNNPPPP